MADSDDGSISKPLIEEERRIIIVYRECRRNHAILVGGYAMDGCSEFAPKVDQGTKEALLCDACGCHRNFHRKVILRNGVTVVESHHSYPPYQLLSPSCGTRNDIGCSPFPSVSPPSVPHYQHHCSPSNPQTVGTDEESVIYNETEKEVEMRARKRPRNNSSKRNPRNGSNES